MRFLPTKLLLGLFCILAFAPACHNSRSGSQIATLAAIVAITNPIATTFALAATDTYPKRLDRIVIRNNGVHSVEYKLDDPSGALRAEPSTGTLDPGQQQEIAVLALGYTYLRAILTLTVVYAAVVGSTDELVVPFAFLLNNPALPALAAIMAITGPATLRHLLTPQMAYPYGLGYLKIKNTATTGPPVDYEVQTGSGLSGDPIRGRLKPGEEAMIDVSAVNSTWAVAALTVVMTYAIIANADRLVRSYEFQNASPPSLAVLGIIALITANDATVLTRFWQALILTLIGIIVFHSIGRAPWNKVPLLLYTEIALVGVLTVVMTLAMLQRNFYRNRVQKESVTTVNFPPGQGPNGYTIHPNKEVDIAPGDFHIFHMTTKGDIPIKDANAKKRYVYSFVMDSDGATANNWIPSTSFPSDFFKDTDRWYQITYDSQSGWRLIVSAVDNTGRNAVEVTSSARAILKDNGIVLVVPKSEFASAKPSWRATAFCHEGDFGINPPYVWSGDVEPPVSKGLHKMK